MAEITPRDYIDIMNLYTAASLQLVGISQQYYDAAYDIVILQSFDPEIDLLLPFFNAYLASSTAYASAIQSVVDAVKSLQDHVLRRARTTAGLAFSTINDWYTEDPSSFPDGQQPLQGTPAITAEFATLSQQAGHRIENGTGTDTRDFVA